MPLPHPPVCVLDDPCCSLTADVLCTVLWPWLCVRSVVRALDVRIVQSSVGAMGRTLAAKAEKEEAALVAELSRIGADPSQKR